MKINLRFLLSGFVEMEVSENFKELPKQQQIEIAENFLKKQQTEVIIKSMLDAGDNIDADRIEVSAIEYDNAGCEGISSKIWMEFAGLLEDFYLNTNQITLDLETGEPF